MPRILETKTTFTAGEVSKDLLGRGDLAAYDNGASSLRNVFIQPTGGVTRRAGLSYVGTALGDGRLIAFEFNTAQTYLIVLTHLKISIYANGALITTITSPWTLAQIPNVAWTQSADTLLLVHPDVFPRKLTRNAGGTWTLSNWSFFFDGSFRYQPYYKFADSSVTVQSTAAVGAATLTASSAVFTAGHVGTRLHIEGIEALITGYTSATVVSIGIVGTLPSLAPTIDWQEEVFNDLHGYPVSVAFHQDRLVIGGSRDIPNHIWFSKSGDLFNFDLGTGLDDEAIEFGILSDQVNAIRGIFSGRHLQILTSGSEWTVTGDPLTPSSVQIRRQTRAGSAVDRYIPPVNVDGATLFAGRRNEIQEFVYTDVEQAYSSTDLALLSRQIVGRPIDQDYDAARRLLFVVRDDGAFATLTVFRAEQVAAWTLHQTDGTAKSVAVVGDDVYLLIQRSNGYFIEKMEDGVYLDAALSGTSLTPKTTWTGLAHLNGKTVSVVGDGIVQANKTVSGGSVTIAAAASNVVIGLPYTHIIEPLPPSDTGEAGSGRKRRMVQAYFRIKDTATLTLDVGQGLEDVSLLNPGETSNPAAPLPLVTREMAVRALGWQSDALKPL